jgi:hypothetical protein
MTDQPALDSQPSTDHASMIAALREQGADRLDPVRFHFIETMAKRAQTQTAQVRRVVDDKLAAALAEYRRRFEQAKDHAVETALRLEHKASDTPLADLLCHIAQQASLAPDDSPAELKSLRQFRDSWAKLSVNQTVNKALAAGPSNAGPLNSHALVLRALKHMRDAVPDYLGHFMAYADTLLWLDQANVGSTSTKKNAGRGKASGKRKLDRGEPG